MRFSIIIPVYNVEKYIRKCLQTVMEQTFRDYEVIVVDDETPDNSMAIVEEFSEKYPGMIKIIHQKNTRQGGARNRGVREAQGEYILFVDSDDYVSLHMLEVVDKHLKEQDCDILSFTYRMVTPHGKKLQAGGLGDLHPGRYVPSIDKEILLLPAGPVHKAYRRSFFLACDMWFPEKVLYEDAVVRIYFAQANAVVLIEDCLYYYVQTTNSSIRQKPSPKMLDILNMTQLVCEEFERRGLYELFREQLEASLIYGILYILDLINNSDKYNTMQEHLVDYIIEHFPGCIDNKYFDPSCRKALMCLFNKDFVAYYWHYLAFRQIKEYLLRYEWISWLNKKRHEWTDGRKYT